MPGGATYRRWRTPATKILPNALANTARLACRDVHWCPERRAPWASVGLPQGPPLTAEWNTWRPGAVPALPRRVPHAQPLLLDRIAHARALHTFPRLEHRSNTCALRRPNPAHLDLASQHKLSSLVAAAKSTSGMAAHASQCVRRPHSCASKRTRAHTLGYTHAPLPPRLTPKRSTRSIGVETPTHSCAGMHACGHVAAHHFHHCSSALPVVGRRLLACTSRACGKAHKGALRPAHPPARCGHLSNGK